MNKSNNFNLKSMIDVIEKKSLKKITKNTDLVADGILDSFGFIELIMDIEKKCNINIKIDKIDELELTIFVNLERYIKKNIK